MNDRLCQNCMQKVHVTGAVVPFNMPPIEGRGSVYNQDVYREFFDPHQFGTLVPHRVLRYPGEDLGHPGFVGVDTSDVGWVTTPWGTAYGKYGAPVVTKEVNKQVQGVTAPINTMFSNLKTLGIIAIVLVAGIFAFQVY